jgi:RNA polymerase sigma-70 factor (ECF subfamily)
MAEPSDEILFQRLASGDVGALGAVYDRYAPLVNGLARRILRDPRDAEDVVQDVFVQVWREADRFDVGRGSPLGWICMMARSRAIDRLRRRTARREERDADPDRRPAEDAPFEPVLAVSMRTALRTLPREQRLALELAYYEGLTQTEIAERLVLPLGTVKTRMRSGLLRLRTFLTSDS